MLGLLSSTISKALLCLTELPSTSENHSLLALCLEELPELPGPSPPPSPVPTHAPAQRASPVGSSGLQQRTNSGNDFNRSEDICTVNILPLHNFIYHSCIFCKLRFYNSVLLLRCTFVCQSVMLVLFSNTFYSIFIYFYHVIAFYFTVLLFHLYAIIFNTTAIITEQEYIFF